MGAVRGPLGVPPEPHEFNQVKTPRLPVAENAINSLQGLPPGVGATSTSWSAATQMNRILARTGFQESFQVEIEGKTQQVIVRGLDFEVADRVQQLVREQPVDFLVSRVESQGDDIISDAIRFVIAERLADPEKVSLIMGNRTNIVYEREEPLPELKGSTRIQALSPFQQFIEMLIHYVKHGEAPYKTEYDTKD